MRYQFPETAASNYIYVVGEKFDLMPRSVRLLLQKQGDIVDSRKDISVLTIGGVSTVIFHFTQEQEELLNISIKICLNLGKQLVVLHKKGDESHKINHISYVKQIDISRKSGITLLRSLFQTNQEKTKNNENVMAFFQGKEKNIGSGSKINIQRTLEHIEQNLAKKINEDDLARLNHISTSYFSKVFHEVMGASFRDYVVDKKIALSKQLIKNNRHEKIASIAYQCGYNDVAYFSRIFKKRTGQTPGEYRSNLTI